MLGGLDANGMVSLYIDVSRMLFWEFNEYMVHVREKLPQFWCVRMDWMQMWRVYLRSIMRK